MCSLSLLLDLEELRNGGVLDSELKMVHLSVEMDHFLIRKSLFLDSLEGYIYGRLGRHFMDIYSHFLFHKSTAARANRHNIKS